MKGRLYWIFVLIFIFNFSGTVLGQADYNFFNTVKQVCKVYNIDIMPDEFRVYRTETYGRVATLSLKSGRNDFDKVMLVGFIAMGKAMLTTNRDMDQVNIVISIPYKEREQIFASAPGDDVKKIIDGRLSIREFIEHSVIFN